MKKTAVLAKYKGVFFERIFFEGCFGQENKGMFHQYFSNNFTPT